ncbi:biotin--[acetyl-CoA-carboxylase] ligase [Nocardiopsis gilva YIM 90087]|uniref:biotin--[biotin carboxyl-carrier protein] ligase n=1 Tax=Nocardiopsis gilva YIM 90087 TaxID=1235441 RepID=A0A223SBI9_9ACTN|nr:biotin--[acetyl-CoA-carboxylase] ligase [Nocardiopsis gilva]ASU85541.1 biotin--[acetyl-CoA-carboxylase] ligase [Nocardiopsis gilva YIM 90087]
MTGESPFTDLDRPPLREIALQRVLVRPGGLWTGIEVVPELGSTNTELVRRARDGAPEGTVLVTEHQTAGRGRLDRTFETPARAALTFSVLVRPDVPVSRLGWLPLLMGVAAVHGVRRIGELPASLKWPNDVLSRGVDGEGTERKLAGILSEAAFPAEGPASGERPAVVIGMGLNVLQRRDELPVDSATSLAADGAPVTDRDPLLRAVLRGFAELYTAWVDHGGDAEASGLAEEYRSRCGTIGGLVRVHLPGERTTEGKATGIDAEGRLLVRTGAGGEEALSAGDVVHVRPATE